MSKSVSMNEHIKKAAYDMLYLAGCGITGTHPEKGKIKDMDFAFVHALSRRHSVEALTYTALEPLLNADTVKNDETLKVWKEERDKAITKELLMDAERESLFAFMEQKGIWHMPRKGIILKQFYPGLGQRQMSDNDIFYDKTYQDEICSWFKSRDYNVVLFQKGRDDVYTKEPIYNFEMSVDLFDEKVGRTLTSYYKNIREKLLPKEGTKCELRFTDEDFYIYFIAHAYMHATKSRGIGLKTLLDCYVFLKNREGTLNRQYISEELNKVGLDKLEKQIHELSFTVFSAPDKFSPEELSPEIRNQLEDIIIFFGTNEKAMDNHLQDLKEDSAGSMRKAKLKYLRLRLFPPMTYYEQKHPFLYHNKFFIPFFVVYRIVVMPFKYRKEVKGELDFLLKKDKKADKQ